MCIVCNAVLTDFAAAQHAMRAAADAMLRCAQHATTSDARRQYYRTHKVMVGLIRDWNCCEHVREQHPDTEPGA